MIANPDEYRYKCPNGHVTIRQLNNKPRGATTKQVNRGKALDVAYYCKTCRCKYPGNAIDTKGMI